MLKEDLIALGLTEEQVTSVQKLSGTEISTMKQEITSLKSDLEISQTSVATLTSQLGDANAKVSELSKLENVDVEELQASLSKYQSEMETLKAEHETKITEMERSHKIDNALRDAGARNAKAARALLDNDKLVNADTFDEELKDLIEGLKESDSYLFGVENNPGGSLGGAKLPNDKPLEEMTYTERIEYLSQNPSVK